VTDEYTPAGWGTGVVAESGDHEPGSADHFKSWNRWRDHGGSEPAVEARPNEATITEPAEDLRREEAGPSLDEGEEDGYVPMRRSANTKRRSRRRGGGRHSLNERKRSKKLGSRRARRKSEDDAPPSVVAPAPRHEATSAPRPAPRHEVTPEPRHEVAPEPRHEATSAPRPAPRPEITPAPRPEIVSNSEAQVASDQRRRTGLARTEAVAELRTLVTPETGVETDRMPQRRRMPEVRHTEPTKAIDELIQGTQRESLRRTADDRVAEPKSAKPKEIRRGRAADTDSAPRRSRVRLSSTKILLIAVLVLSVATGAVLLRRSGDSPGASGAPTGAGGGEAVTTTLIAGTEAPGEKATWLTLLSYDKRMKEGAVVYVPAHTAVEVPGRGLQGVGDSLTDGDMDLLVLSAKSLLNVEIDHYLELTPQDTRALFSGLGSLTVEVPGEVRISAGRGTARLLFPQGSQELTPDRIAQLLFTRGVESDELDLGPRHLAVWDALFDAYEENPEQLATALNGAGEVGRADTELSEYVDVIASVAAAGSQARNLSVLPVAPVSVGDSELYTIDEAELGEFMRTTAHAEAPLHDVVRVQVLNGNGYPGIGQEVADRLLADGFRVVLSGNARSLDHRRTLVVTYDATPEGLDLAEQARDLIGVGEVQVSRLDQGIVDLTIVVGKDFLRKP
jgi:hypothetical protein